ncbi:hypothetical protein HELRODRAFT_90186 [Helobdella robusta]|uniref:peptidylamidoglycolate lyase n=1 Tax=Helobdella robusta TaxID=6412 RepID=T1G7M0_HELRO|nr:hypothetical protein HELRODRAFT_90186 [Helobdella robusta]ESN91973.1 hypothetical protein HELRODRAFT_90186 [Helobdella robusta]
MADELGTDSREIFNGHFEVDENWPYDKFPIGQVGGVAMDSKGLLHILHRADRVWDGSSFNESIVYVDHGQQKIKKPTILVVNTTDGTTVKHWGSDLFVMPHGLEIDSKDNIYVTDVGLHQVFKFESGKTSPYLSLGIAFEPAGSNDDMERFCQPSDVAVAANGDFFVSDGYCNSRIVKYNKDGMIISIFGADDSNIPHSLALVEDMDYLCVADRENMRVLCYRAGLTDANNTGAPVVQFINKEIGRVFGITYNGLLYGVTGPTGILKNQGFSLDVKNSEAYDTNGFANPHCITVSKDGGTVYVGEIDPNFVWKMEKDE